ncbi:hypothetical protein TRAPUB_2342 [Trametes pubescens]|uniref:Septin-type G domain-containing protein n=1 Tax=Trametes pubescens TaxID=154538 RepID=A0A1M2VGV7_TRAPU|nr:hypothetical protein TRAPUB_2342 [Trametes pubescens]
MPMQDHEPSTSADTIRGLRHLDMSLMSEHTMAHDEHEDASPNHPGSSLYHPPSPFSAFQSEPGSPSGDSVSSFPSVSSSFLFSSGPASHPPSEPDSDLGDSTSGLVIPSLMLPSPSKRPTPYGQTLGELRLLLLGPKGVDLSAIASQLVDDSEDVVEVGIWEEDRPEGGNTRGKRKASLRVSTHWVEHRDAHGLERVEPARNVEIMELSPYDPYSEADVVVQHVLPIIHSPFYQVMSILNREHPPSGTLAHILSSSSSPLHTALILVACPSPTPAEKSLIEALSPHIPIVVLPLASPATRDSPPNVSYKISSPHLSSFRPASIDALRIGLFRNPSTLARLRAEAASRFLRWREVERAVERVQWGVHASTSQTTAMKTPMPAHAHPNEKRGWWDKEEWEAQWEGELSHEVALHLRRRRAGTVRRITPLSSLPPASQTSYFRARDAPSAVPDTPMPRDADEQERGLLSPSCPSAAFDPLHIPSLVVFSVSLLGALRTRVARSVGLHGVKRAAGAVVPEDGQQRRGGRSFGYRFGIGFALMSAFCAGVGIGLLAARF